MAAILIVFFMLNSLPISVLKILCQLQPEISCRSLVRRGLPPVRLPGRDGIAARIGSPAVQYACRGRDFEHQEWEPMPVCEDAGF